MESVQPRAKSSSLSKSGPPLDGTECGLEEIEGLQHNKELWIICIPSDVNISSLSGKNVTLADTKQILATGKKEYDVKVSQETMMLSNIVIPLSEPGRLACGPDISGEVRLQQAMNKSAINTPATLARSEEILLPLGLKQRWKPFGWETPYKGQGNKRKCMNHKKAKKRKLRGAD